MPWTRRAILATIAFSICAPGAVTGQEEVAAPAAGFPSGGLFPFYTRSHDPADGTEYFQVAGLFHRWRQFPPGASTGATPAKETTFLFPLYFHQRENERFFTTILPLYYSWGTSSEHTSIGFPLYWASHDATGGEGEEGWQVLAPFYFHIYSPGNTDRFFLPLYAYRTSPGREQHSVLGPAYVYERFHDREGNLSGSGHSLLWPLIKYESREAGAVYRFLPFFSVSSHADGQSLLVTPFYYRERDPGGSFYYLFPFHSRTRTIAGVRDDFALGVYTRRRALDERGDTLRSGHDVLWKLFSYERDFRSGAVHRHALPLGYWDTRTPAGGTTVLGPFYFSSTQADAHGRWSLDLILGNLYVSSRFEGPGEEVDPITLPRTFPPSETAEDDGSADGARLEAPERDASARPGRPGTEETAFVERSRDEGVLWPLTRWYRDDLGHRGRWVLPFYFRSSSRTSQKLGVFPFAYHQVDAGGYELNYFRHFYLVSGEEWATGSRLSVGQFIFDWRTETATDHRHLALLYPLFELDYSNRGYSFHLLHLIAAEDRSEVGDRIASHYLFPFFWLGGQDRVTSGGEWLPERRHLFILPLFGYQTTVTTADYYALFPLLHLKLAPDTLETELWPFFFYRSHPTVEAIRVWPFHSHETGEQAGELWPVADWLFLSKLASKPRGLSYRLEPFLFSYSRDDDGGTSDLALLFSLYRQRSADGMTRRTLFWFIDF